jgi:hypothetical protein
MRPRIFLGVLGRYAFGFGIALVLLGELRLATSYSSAAWVRRRAGAGSGSEHAGLAGAELIDED